MMFTWWISWGFLWIRKIFIALSHLNDLLKLLFWYNFPSALWNFYFISFASVVTMNQFNVNLIFFFHWFPIIFLYFQREKWAKIWKLFSILLFECGIWTLLSWAANSSPHQYANFSVSLRIPVSSCICFPAMIPLISCFLEVGFME